MTIGKCVACGKQEEIHAHGKCYHCYRKTYHQPQVKCKVCGLVKEHRAKGMCFNCAQKAFYYDTIRGFNVKKYHNISFELWKEVTKKCAICDFDKIVDLHHLDHNKNNTSRENLVGLCPNHHKMIHDMRFKNEIENKLKEHQSKQ